jgi:hypothetical protein
MGASVTGSLMLQRMSIPAACALSYFGSGLLLLLIIFSSIILLSAFDFQLSTFSF